MLLFRLFLSMMALNVYHFYRSARSFFPTTVPASHALFSFLAMWSCGCSSGELQHTLHPTPQNIPVISDSAYILTAGDNVTNPGSDYFEIATDTLVIGKDDSIKHHLFGRVPQVATDHHQFLFVLDSEFNEVRIFDYEGNYVSSFGRAGPGPGEFAAPEFIAVSDSGNHVIVFDSRGDIEVYERQAAGVYQFRNSVKKNKLQIIPFGTTMCAMHGHLFLLAYRPDLEGIIHKVTIDGDLVMSFGPQYDFPSDFVVASLTARGFIACSEKYNVVAWIRTNVPVITGFSGYGEFLWNVRLDGFKPIRIASYSEYGGPVMEYSQPIAGESIVRRVFVDSQGRFNLLYSVFPYDRNQLEPQHLFVIQALSGIGEYKGDAYALAGVSSSHMWRLLYNPFPEIHVMSYDE